MTTISPALNALLQEVTSNLKLYHDRAARVFHGRGHAFSSLEYLNIEWYPPYLFVQNFTHALDQDTQKALKTLMHEEEQKKAYQVEAILIQNRYGPEITTEILAEKSHTELPLTIWSPLNESLSCQVTLGKNRNTGVFLDMRAGWDWVLNNSTHQRVLNLFSYTGVFSLFALKGQAANVVNIDMASGALKTAQRNHQFNQCSDGKASFYKRDILKSAQQFSRMGPYDLIIIDPPPYQRKSFTGWADYQKLLTRCEKSLNEQGKILACLNNPQVRMNEFIKNIHELLPSARLLEKIDSSPEIKEQDENKGLKIVAIHF